MNVFWVELKAHRKSLVLWSIGIFFMIVAGMGKYAAFKTSGQSINELFAGIPDTLKAIFGLGNFDLTKASGFYGVLYLYLLVMATIHSSMLGANIISKEERDRTAEFLMVKPASRSKIVTQKLLAGVVNVFVINIITLTLSIAVMGKYSDGELVTSDIFVLMAGMLFIQLIFLFIGTGIAALSKNPAVPASIATTVLLVAFVMYIVIDMNSSLEFLKYLTPFKYFEAKNMMYGGGLDPLFVVLSLALIAVLVCVTYFFYKKRDLKV